jgi:hypothetical protein
VRCSCVSSVDLGTAAVTVDAILSSPMLPVPVLTETLRDTCRLSAQFLLLSWSSPLHLCSSLLLFVQAFHIYLLIDLSSFYFWNHSNCSQENRVFHSLLLV